MRRGLTLTEVLISMGILTLGLLGVMSLFPVGAHYMNNAERAESAASVARSVMGDIAARGLLNANQWRMASIPSVTTPALQNIDDKSPTGTSVTNVFNRPVGAAAEVELNAGASPLRLAQVLGSAYVLDPMAVAVTTVPASAPANTKVAPFPAEANLLPISTYNSVAAWQPWTGSADHWPIRRVTLVQPHQSAAYRVKRMEAPLAWTLFSSTSDLSFELPTSDDQPAIQLASWKDFNENGQRDPKETLSRQSAGDYSWLVTIAPTTNDARNNPASGAFTHNVSVVVFYKRGVSPNAPTSAAAALQETNRLFTKERAVKAKILTSGPNGGEVILESIYTGVNNSFDELYAGQWLMLCGPKPSTSPADPQFTLNWYQIQAVDGEAEGVPGFNRDTMRAVVLRGPEWPWQPQAGPNDLSNNLCVGIFPGAVAVHTKTLRMAN